MDSSVSLWKEAMRANLPRVVALLKKELTERGVCIAAIAEEQEEPSPVSNPPAAAVRPIPTVSVNGRKYDEVSHLAALTIQGAFKRMKGREKAEEAADAAERPPDVIVM